MVFFFCFLVQVAHSYPCLLARLLLNSKFSKALGLDDNFISGSIPTEIGLLTRLNSFGLVSNFLTGTIPTEIFMASVRSLNLARNLLNGTLSTEIGLLSNLGKWHEII